MFIKPTIYIIIGIIIGIAFTKLFTPTNILPQETAITTPSTLKEQTAKTAVHYQQKVDSLKLIAKDLSNKLTNNKSALVIAKNRALVLQTQLLTANKMEFISDNETHVLDCSPKEDQLTAFIQVNDHKDSLYETIDSTRIMQLQNKDASLTVKDSMYHSLKQSFEQSLNEQQLLYTQNSLLRTQINRQKRKGKIVSAAILLISATAANYLLKY
jgi:hypothetical protein